MDLVELKRAYACAWHSTFAGGWEVIRDSPLGLAPTSTLLDAYGVEGERRILLEQAPRAACEPLEADGLPLVRIRDQMPLLPIRNLERVLAGSGMTTAEWCLELNRRVFFFVSQRPLERILKAYGEQQHDVLVIDAKELVDRYMSHVTLSSINTGAIQPAYAPRGRGTFLSMTEYPTTVSGRPAKPVAEITVSKGILDIAELVVRVERWKGPTKIGELT